MNDNEQIDEFDIPDFAWDTVDRHGLGVRADCPQAAVIVLLTDAAGILPKASLTSFRDQVVSPAVEHPARDVHSMVADAPSLAVLCPREPVPGIVPGLADGTLPRRGAGAADLHER